MFLFCFFSFIFSFYLVLFCFFLFFVFVSSLFVYSFTEKITALLNPTNIYIYIFTHMHTYLHTHIYIYINAAHIHISIQLFLWTDGNGRRSWRLPRRQRRRWRAWLRWSTSWDRRSSSWERNSERPPRSECWDNHNRHVPKLPGDSTVCYGKWPIYRFYRWFICDDLPIIQDWSPLISMYRDNTKRFPARTDHSFPILGSGYCRVSRDVCHAGKRTKCDEGTKVLSETDVGVGSQLDRNMI